MKLKLLFLNLILLFLLTACAYPKNQINVISREDGSGTRDAFTSLFQLTSEDENGIEKDKTLSTSEITNSTAVVLQTVSEDKNAIGYISMGSLNNNVKALSIDGVKASPANVKSKEYPIYRPFILIFPESSGEIEQDFINFIQSNNGKTIIEENDYIPISDKDETYQETSLSGKIVINGSSSVTPVMEALAEEYMKINPQIDIEVQQTDSTTGISSVSEGIANLGMSSRDLKDEEIKSGLRPVTFAYDGLTVIVNNENPLDNLSKEKVNNIYTGEITNWTELEKNE